MVDAIDLMVGIIGGRWVSRKWKIGKFGEKSDEFVVILGMGGYSEVYWLWPLPLIGGGPCH